MEEPRGEIGGGGTPKIGFDQKHTGFERFISIPESSENLSKFHDVKEKLDPKIQTDIKGGQKNTNVPICA